MKQEFVTCLLDFLDNISAFALVFGRGTVFSSDERVKEHVRHACIGIESGDLRGALTHCTQALMLEKKNANLWCLRSFVNAGIEDRMLIALGDARAALYTDDSIEQAYFLVISILIKHKDAEGLIDFAQHLCETPDEYGFKYFEPVFHMSEEYVKESELLKQNDQTKVLGLYKIPVYGSSPEQRISAAAEDKVLGCNSLEKTQHGGIRLRSGRDFKANAPIASEIFEACASSDNQLCEYCLKDITHRVSCKECKHVCYCSEKCRDRAFNAYHKTLCGTEHHTLRANDYQKLAHYVAFQIAARTMQHTRYPCSTFDLPFYRSLRPLQAIYSKSSPVSLWYQCATTSGMMCEPLFDISWYLQIMGIIHTCWSTLETNNNHKTAMLTRTVAFMDHSCDPNVIFHGSGNSIAYFAKREIRAGEPLTMRYLERDKDFITKMAVRYGFICSCKVCKKSKKRNAVEIKKTQDMLDEYVK